MLDLTGKSSLQNTTEGSLNVKEKPESIIKVNYELFSVELTGKSTTLNNTEGTLNVKEKPESIIKVNYELFNMQEKTKIGFVKIPFSSKLYPPGIKVEEVEFEDKFKN